jgi:multidrug efflux system outer membrane protein
LRSSRSREVADALARRGTIAGQYEAQAQLVAAALDSYMLAEARIARASTRFS